MEVIVLESSGFSANRDVFSILYSAVNDISLKFANHYILLDYNDDKKLISVFLIEKKERSFKPLEKITLNSTQISDEHYLSKYSGNSRKIKSLKSSLKRMIIKRLNINVSTKD